MEKLRLLLYEDRSDFRASLEMLFKGLPDLHFSGAYPNCKNVAEQIVHLKPDVVLMDINMPEFDGLFGLQKIREIRPQTEVIMFTVFQDDEKIFKSLQLGASGYILKDTPPMELYAAIKDVASGGSPMSPGIARRVLNTFQKISPGQEAKQIFNLSKREIEILGLMVKGYTYKRIAAECFISLDTVRGHMKNIYTKMQVNSGREAVVQALRDKIIDME